MEGCDPGGVIRIVAVGITFLGLLAFFELENRRENLEKRIKKGKLCRKDAIRIVSIIQVVIAVVIIASNSTFMLCFALLTSRRRSKLASSPR